MNAPDPRVSLALRLRALRENHWPSKKITQSQLARALGGVSVPLISSWESLEHPRVPPERRLEAYAALFATLRSFDSDPPRQLGASELTSAERQVMNDLMGELRRLRLAALRAEAVSTGDRRPLAESISDTPWHFDDRGSVNVVCAQLPQEMRDRIPYTNVDDPDFIELLTYSELDSLFELYGHIRAANPSSHVYRRLAGDLKTDDYHTHLAVLGGIDWNPLTSTILNKLQLPVRQIADWDTEGAQYFEVAENGVTTQHRPLLRKSAGRDILEEDVALFARAVNPFNRKRTVTICHGMYGRGTYGAIRALTDYHFRDRNSEYIKSRFSDCETYCILTRVPIIQGETLTPDWTTGDQTLFEWSR